MPSGKEQRKQVARTGTGILAFPNHSYGKQIAGKTVAKKRASRTGNPGKAGTCQKAIMFADRSDFATGCRLFPMPFSRSAYPGTAAKIWSIGCRILFLDSDILFHDDRSPKHQRITWDYHRAQESNVPDMNVKKCVSYFENSPYLYLNRGLRGKPKSFRVLLCLTI